MWSESSGALPDPDTLIQFLLTPMNPPASDEHVLPRKTQEKSGSAGGEAPAASAAAGEGDEGVAQRLCRLEQRMEALRAVAEYQQQQRRRPGSRSPSPPVKDGNKEKRVTFAVRDSERSASDSEALMAELVDDPDVLAMVSPQQCKLCHAYAQRYREEQRERVKQEVTCATLGQALCGAEAERDKLKSGLAHIQSEIQRMKEETVRLESTREKISRELRRSEEDRSDLQLKLKVMSECVRKRDLELSIQRQALDDRDRRLKDAQTDAMSTSRKLVMAQEQLQHHQSESAAHAHKVVELKDLLAEREKQHMTEMKRKNSADNPVVQKLVSKAAEEARASVQREATSAQHKASREMSTLRKDNERMAAALAKFKERFTEVSTDKAALALRYEQQKRDLGSEMTASQEKEEKITELSQMLHSVRQEIEQLEMQRRTEQTTHTAAVAFLENKVKQLEDAQEKHYQMKSEMADARKRMESTEKRYTEEATLRRAGDARLAVLKQQLDEMTTEHTGSAVKLQAQAEQLRSELSEARAAATEKEQQVTALTEQLGQAKEAATAGGGSSRGRGDASTELENERRRSYRLQAELDRLTENKETLLTRMEHAERELDRCAKKNESWSKLWEEKVELIRKLEAQVKVGRSMNDDKVDNLRKERDRAMDLAKQAAKKLQTLDLEYQAKMDEMHSLFEAQLSGVRAAKDHEIQKSSERVREIEAMLTEVSAETAANRTSLEDKMRRINLITKGFEA